MRSRWGATQLGSTCPAAHASVILGAPCHSFADDAQSLSGHSRDSLRAEGQTPGIVPHVSREQGVKIPCAQILVLRFSHYSRREYTLSPSQASQSQKGGYQRQEGVNRFNTQNPKAGGKAKEKKDSNEMITSRRSKLVSDRDKHTQPSTSPVVC